MGYLVVFTSFAIYPTIFCRLCYGVICSKIFCPRQWSH